MTDRDKRASTPFRFVSCMELREVLGREAMDEQRLLEPVEEVPGDSIYYHTHSYYLRHPYTQVLFPNDFATWVTTMLRIDCSASVWPMSRSGSSSHEPCRPNARPLEPRWRWGDRWGRSV